MQVRSFLGLLDLTPLEGLFEHDSGCLNGAECTDHAAADPEDDDHEDDTDEGVWVDPVDNAGVGVVDLGIGNQKLFKKLANKDFCVVFRFNGKVNQRNS